jgi:hypothetical protein
VTDADAENDDLLVLVDSLERLLKTATTDFKTTCDLCGKKKVKALELHSKAHAQALLWKTMQGKEEAKADEVKVDDAEGIESITQKHNTALQNKRLVLVNEMSSTRDNFRSNFDKIKSYITDDTLLIEPKGRDAYQINNISNFLLFTNHRDAIIVEESDRRYAVFEMSTCRKGDWAYWKTLHDSCMNQDVANAFYSYLLDFPAVQLRNIPETELRKEMMSLSKPSPLKFLDAVNASPEERQEVLGNLVSAERKVKGNVFYNAYVRWCQDSGERAVSSTKFGLAMKQKLEHKRGKTGLQYTLLPALETTQLTKNPSLKKKPKQKTKTKPKPQEDELFSDTDEEAVAMEARIAAFEVEEKNRPKDESVALTDWQGNPVEFGPESQHYPVSAGRFSRRTLAQYGNDPERVLQERGLVLPLTLENVRGQVSKISMATIMDKKGMLVFP